MIYYIMAAVAAYVLATQALAFVALVCVPSDKLGMTDKTRTAIIVTAPISLLVIAVMVVADSFSGFFGGEAIEPVE